MKSWELLAKAPDDPRAFAELFSRHKNYVFRLAFGLVGGGTAADDVVQEVFLKIGEGRARGRPKALFRTWLYQVTVNTCREQNRRFSKPLEHGAKESASAVGLQGEMIDLEAALKKLPLRQREVVLLRFLEGMSTRETALAMGCREGTVKAHLHRAAKAVRKFI